MQLFQGHELIIELSGHNKAHFCFHVVRYSTMRKQKVVYLVIPFKHQPVWIFSFCSVLDNNKPPLGWPLYDTMPYYTEWISILCCLHYSWNPSQLYKWHNAHSSQLLLTSVWLKILCGNKFHIIMWQMAKAPYESYILWSRFFMINYLILRNQPFAFSR